MSIRKDTDLIWESYQNTLNEAGKFSMDKLIYMGEEQFNKMRGKADHDEILRDIEQTYIKYFQKNMNQYANADDLINYLEDGGFRDDLMNQLGIDDEREQHSIDSALDKWEW